MTEPSDEQRDFADNLLDDLDGKEHILARVECARRIAARDARLAAQTVPAEKLLALVEELERIGRESQYVREALAYDHARRRIRDLLPKPEEKTDG